MSNTRRLITLSLYAAAYIAVSLVMVFGFTTFHDMFTADPIPTASGIALAIVIGLYMTDAYLCKTFGPPTM